jgi:glutaredoxin
MALKLHRCTFGWLRLDRCNRVQRALDDQGIEYEVVVHPWARHKRQAMIELSGQKYYPVLEFEDGSVYREESKDMAATIRAGKLDEKRCREASGVIAGRS